jgi:peptidyl-tRNA hydrolase, PTH1 family
MNYCYFGLGNPGEKYASTRHNAGQLVLSLIEVESSIIKSEILDHKKSLATHFEIQNAPAIFFYPKCFMNSSGGFVKRFRNPENMIIVVYDDIDLPFGEVRFSYNKSGGSHNGVLSIVKALGTQKFATVRIGISQTDSLGRIRRITGAGKVQDFVMADFSHDELTRLKKEISKKVENIMKLLPELGIQKTLSIYKIDTKL